jgi:hypothetical protein
MLVCLVLQRIVRNLLLLLMFRPDHPMVHQPRQERGAITARVQPLALALRLALARALPRVGSCSSFSTQVS